MTYQQINQAAFEKGLAADIVNLQMRLVFEKYQNPTDWKDGFNAANVPATEVEWLKAAIIHFHGTKFYIVDGKICTPGYDAY